MSIQDTVAGVIALDEARANYIEAEEMYSGTASETFANSQIEREIARTGAMGKVNLVKRITSTVANRIKLSAVTVPEASEEVNNRLDLIREANDMDVYEKILIRKTLMYGDSYITVWNIDPDDDTENDSMREAGVSLDYNSPLSMRMIYDPNNERKALFAIKSWSEGSNEKRVRRADVYYRDRVERYITVQPNVNGHKPEQWMSFDEDIINETGEIVSDNGVIFHDFGEIPVIHFRTDLTYGTPEAIDGYSLQGAINKALVTLVATIERTGYPVRYKLMYPEAILDNTAEQDPDWDLDETVPSSPVKQAAATKDTPGAVKEEHGVKDIKEFSPANPAVFLDPIMSFIKLMALATETPAYELNPQGEQPSGESRRQADKPLEAKVNDRQVFLRGSFANLYRIALKAVDIIVKKVDIQWAPTSPINDAEGWATIKAKQEAGVPVTQALAEAGYSEDLIAEWTDNVAEATTLTEKLEYLSKIATAMKDLGSAVTMQVISPEQVETIVDSLIASLEGTE
jgi:hypothetical protein